MRPWRIMIICKWPPTFFRFAFTASCVHCRTPKLRTRENQEFWCSGPSTAIEKFGERRNIFSVWMNVLLSCGTLLLIFPHWDARRRRESVEERNKRRRRRYIWCKAAFSLAWICVEHNSVWRSTRWAFQAERIPLWREREKSFSWVLIQKAKNQCVSDGITR